MNLVTSRFPVFRCSLFLVAMAALNAQSTVPAQCERLITANVVALEQAIFFNRLGAMLPHDSALARDLRAKCEDLVSVLLLPLFFAFTGLRTQIGLLNSGREWIVCGVIILVASLGKFGGSYAAARVAGVEWREAASLGVLMNTRGLMELIVLNVGLDLGVLSPSLFAMFVVMALVTTLATAPVLEGLERKTETEAA